MKRRFFLFAAPAIVAAPSLMRVSTAIDLIAPQTVIGTPTLNEIIMTTLRARSEELAANVTMNNAILRALREQSGVTSLMMGIDRAPLTFWQKWRLTS